jgi:predicted phage terminase large subunit-like protein
MSMSAEDDASRALELERELWFRKCRSCLIAFAIEVMTARGFTPALHQRYILERTEALITGTLRARDDVPQVLCRLMVLLPPAASKTFLCSHILPAWFMAYRPGSHVVTLSHTDQFSMENSQAVQALVREFSHVLGYTLESEARDSWFASNGSHYSAAGVGGILRGRRADLLIVDDPIKDRAMADSEVERNKQWRWWNSDLSSRPKFAYGDTPPGSTILIGTPLHQMDLLSRLRREDAESWDILHLPAEALANDPLGREPGEFLWSDDPKSGYPNWLKVEKARLMRIGAMFEWRSAYMGDPVGEEGSIFTPRSAQIVDDVPTNAKYLIKVRAWDLASTEGRGDWTATVLMGAYMHSVTDEHRWVVLEADRIRARPHKVREFFAAKVKADGTRTAQWLPEDPGQAGKEQLQSYVSMMRGYSVHGLRMTGSKEVRARPFAAQFNAGNVVIMRAPWNAAYLEELGSFPIGTHDDWVDASSLAFTQAQHSSLAQWLRL